MRTNYIKNPQIYLMWNISENYDYKTSLIFKFMLNTIFNFFLKYDFLITLLR